VKENLMQPIVTPRTREGAHFTLAILLLLTLLVTACAGSATAGSAPAGSTGSTSGVSGQSAGAQPASPQPASSQTFTVQMNDANKFVPATMSVPVGSTVTWTNIGQVTHTVTFDPSKAIRASDVSLPSGVAPWDSGNVDGGQSYSFTFSTSGTYHYICIPHEELGMLATITVTN
jgi:plastocyanin